MDEKLIKQVLQNVMEQDVETIEEAMKNSPEHVFSNTFETEMKALISKSDKRYVSIEKRTFRKASMIAAVAIMLFACVGFSPIAKAVWDYCTTIFQKEEFGNIAMGLGRAAFDGEKVYFGVSEGHGINLYSYDVHSEELDFISYEKTPMRASLFADDEFLYYGSVSETPGLNRISKDGNTVEQVLTYKNGFQQIFVDEKYAYILEAIDDKLIVKSLADGNERELFSSVLSYFVDNEKIYVIAREDNIPYLFVAQKDSLEFQKQNLLFTPIAIYVLGGEIYLAKQGDYQIICVSNGEEKLPIYGTHYQVVDDKIVYLDSTTFEDSCFDLVSYDLTSGQSEVISKNVFDFAVLDDDYIYIQCDTMPNAEFYLYDFQNLKRIF